MIWEHFKAIAWLRWRLSRNQWKRAGKINAVLIGIVTVVLLVLAGGSFFLALFLGFNLLPKASPTHVMYVWDGLVVAYLFGWLFSLLMEIQRSEILSLSKFLHLPMSLRTAFAMNYLTTFLSLNVICILPAAIGLSIASVYSHGPRMLILVPLVMAFIFMMTTFTYQIQGWVASLISNKRRQRSIVVAITFGFVLLSLLPNFAIQFSVRRASQSEQAYQTELNRLQREVLSLKLPVDKQAQAIREVTEKLNRLRQENSETATAWYAKNAILANEILPVGWLPTGARQLTEGILWPAGLCWLGLTSIGSVSLWRAYLSTIKMYTHQSSDQAIHPNKAIATTAGPLDIRLIERQFPLVSEQSSAVAISSLISFVRAPESKMLFVAPVIFGAMFAVGTFTEKFPSIPRSLSPFVLQAGVGLLAFVYISLTFNTFGMDRSGFRSYVLMPISRKEILIGKNLAGLPIFFVLLIMVAISALYMAPTSILYCVGGLMQGVIVYLATSSLGNWMSILFPMAMVMPSGGKPMQVNYKSAAAQMLAMFICPLIAAPGACAISIEIALKYYFDLQFFPVYLVVSCIELAIAFWLYLKWLDHQAGLLQSREPDILSLLTSNVE